MAKGRKRSGGFFCDNPDCEVIYFAQDNAVIKVDELRTIVGIKAKTKAALVCYCCGVSSADAKHSSKPKYLLLTIVRQRKCACAVRNSSGRCCCLKGFPKNMKN
ncbi:hypothetical protein [Methyloprofundus sedimenti]|uniref:hypothetical protein n=1 Tax=Methyloprofundus sedimenti TaxID=1420851 RepID=UPI00130201DB